MRHKRSVDKGRRMERRKDSMPDEQDVQNERDDRTREAKTVDAVERSRRQKEKRYTENWKKKRPAWNTVRECERKSKWEAELSREGRGPTEETQSCRNNREIEREARIKLRGKNRWCGGRREERKRKERRD